MTTNDAIVHAVEHNGGGITACGIIMAGSFEAMILWTRPCSNSPASP